MIRQTLLVTAVLVAGTVAASCADRSTAPTVDAARVGTPSDASASSKIPPGLAKPGRAALLTDVPVTGALSDGGTFVGTFTAKRIDYDEATKSLVMTGILTGTATTAAGQVSTVTQQFTAPFTLTHSSSAATAGIYQHTQATGTCGILFLDLGPLHLDLLGLTVDLNEVVLAVNAVSGAGNLLGNLLCAVVNLLDVGALIGTIQNLLNVINNVLAGLQPPAAVSGVGFVAPGFLSAGVGFSSRA